MECGSCIEVIPDDSIFCSECGARQEMSRAGGFTSHNSVGLGGQEVSGGRSFGVVSGEAVRQQRDEQIGATGNIPTDIMQQIAQGIQNPQNVTPDTLPQQGFPQNQQYPPQNQQYPPQNQQYPPQNQQFPPQNQQFPQQQSEFPPLNRNIIPSPNDGRSLGDGAMPNKPLNETEVVGSIIANNPSKSPTDHMVNRLAEAERAMKDERRSQWLNMNQSSATNILANLGAELPAHLRQQQVNPAANIMAGAMGQTVVNGPSEALLRRICEVAVRRVARKRGVAVETPQSKAEGDQLKVTVTYVDDGRVLDTPEDLAQAFEHSIQTELALKGYDYSAIVSLFCSKEGEIVKLIGEGSEEVVDEEMFACEICDGLVKESDNECPHCGAMFEDEDAESNAPKSGPPGPGRGGPSKSGGPPGPSRGGPSKSGGPPGPSRAGPSKSGGPPGPSRGGPSKSGGPPMKSGGPPGPSKSGGPPMKSGGPPGPSKSGGPPKGGPKGPKRSPPR
ncbi:MAG: zinc ribbon domain-containing protein [archaeon]|nr:zinc ribbon domain-containing protein [archaeon]MDA1130025.1 zinc ribbon domain-containing protein [archaeon]